jgi:hypothetical protein
MIQKQNKKPGTCNDFLGGMEQADKRTRKDGALGVFGHTRRSNTRVTPVTFAAVDAGLRENVRRLTEDVSPAQVGAISDKAIADGIRTGADRLARARSLGSAQERKNRSILAELEGIETKLTKEHTRFCRASGLEEMGVLGHKKSGPNPRSHSFTDGFAGGRYFIALGNVMRGLIAEIREELLQGQDVTGLLTTLRRVVKDGMTKTEAINFIEGKFESGSKHYF